MDRYII